MGSGAGYLLHCWPGSWETPRLWKALQAGRSGAGMGRQSLLPQAADSLRGTPGIPGTLSGHLCSSDQLG